MPGTRTSTSVTNGGIMKINLKNASAQLLVCAFVLIGFSSCGGAKNRDANKTHSYASSAEKAPPVAHESQGAQAQLSRQTAEPGNYDNEEYGHVGENEFLAVSNNPLST